MIVRVWFVVILLKYWEFFLNFWQEEIFDMCKKIGKKFREKRKEGRRERIKERKNNGMEREKSLKS